MHICHADVFVYRVVGNEPKTRTSGRAGLAACRERACSLRINESVVVVDVGQKSGSSLNPVFARQAEIGHHRPVLRIVRPGSLQRILQGDRQGSALALVRRYDLCKTLPHSRDQNQTENQPRRVLPEMGVAFRFVRLVVFLTNHSSPQDRWLPRTTPKSLNLKDRKYPAIERGVTSPSGIRRVLTGPLSMREGPNIPRSPCGRTKLKLAQPITLFLKAT